MESNLKHVSTVAIMRELLTRAEHMDALLALVNSGVARTEYAPQPRTRATAPARARAAQRRGFSESVFLEKCAGVPFPKTATQIARCLKTTIPTVRHYLRKLEKTGKARRANESRPILWELVG
jgi:DNA-binding transcriptional ArsR family regulator